MEDTKPHAALLASPGMGHLIPVLELGKRLITHHGFQVTVFVVATEVSPAQSLLLQQATTPHLPNLVSLPVVNDSILVDPEASVLEQLLSMVRGSLPRLRSAISAMKVPPTVLIVDMFGLEAFKIANEFEMLKYVYITSNAWFLAFTAYLPVLDKLVETKCSDLQEPTRIPGCKPLWVEHVFEPVLDIKNEMYHAYMRMAVEITMADGVLVNTWENLEHPTLAAMRDDKLLGQIVKAPVYPVGPLTRPIEPTDSENGVLDWLGMQPSESVIYVSFGSGGTLSAKQTTELAWGLELSRQNFVWVIRPPMDDDAAAALFTSADGRDGIAEYLPDGFLERTKKVGCVVPMWAPQAQILGHPSVGGFITHCGWNSTLESMVNGVPMIAWPLYAEQKMNAVMLTEELGVAIRPNVFPTKGVVGREEIATMVRRLMEESEGNAIRAKVKELKYSAEKALSKGGSSYTSLSHVVMDCQMMSRSSQQPLDNRTSTNPPSPSPKGMHLTTVR